MKWILAFLLFLNLGLGAYQYWVVKQPSVAAVVLDAPQLNNLAISSSQQQRLNSASQAQAPERVAIQDQCVRITGLVEGDSLSVVESRLRALEVETTASTSRELLKTDFQVLLGPFSDLEAARSQLDTLSAQDVEGYVITAGENANSLSLGVFSTASNAERRIAELPSLDTVPTVLRKDNFIDAVILEIGVESAKLIRDDTLSSVLSAFEGADFLRYNCN